MNRHMRGREKNAQQFINNTTFLWITKISLVLLTGKTLLQVDRLPSVTEGQVHKVAKESKMGKKDAGRHPWLLLLPPVTAFRPLDSKGWKSVGRWEQCSSARSAEFTQRRVITPRNRLLLCCCLPSLFS